MKKLDISGDTNCRRNRKIEQDLFDKNLNDLIKCIFV